MVRRLALPHQNLYSFAAPHAAWVAHEWLSEVAFYLCFRWLGTIGLITLGTVLNGLACALVFQLTRRCTRSPYVSSLVTLLAAFLMMANFSLRPYLFGNLFFVAALWLLESPHVGGRWRPLIMIRFSPPGRIFTAASSSDSV